MSVQYQDYYKILGISNTATTEEIRSAFRKLAKQYHPDINKTKNAEERFKLINEAYEVLSNPDRRSRYDQFGSNFGAGQNIKDVDLDKFAKMFETGRANPFSSKDRQSKRTSGGFSDFFDILFGGGAERKNFNFFETSGNKNSSIRNEAQRSRADSFRAFTEREAKAGVKASSVRQAQDITVNITISLHEAFTGGKRTVSLKTNQGQTKSYEINIPAGITTGQIIRLKGQAQAITGNSVGGDVLLKVTIAEDPRFVVTGNDLKTYANLAPWEAALGGKLAVETLSGVVNLTIPPGSQSGQKMRLKGYGLSSKVGNSGDLFVELRILVPKTLTAQERELFEKLMNISQFDARKV
ncbi:MAG: DnaJ domain-containing protein [Deltaproteobacteria bacterium]|jgi:curved DNA-binding protein|nr:DnaJ domain-containing protein [Deltaproteobacteria bacterium]